MARSIPQWFLLYHALDQQIMERVAKAAHDAVLDRQVQLAPFRALYFFQDSLNLAREANRTGLHANALALTRQCVEAIGVVELGICERPGAEAQLMRWAQDDLKPGNLRKWLDQFAWAAYGEGLWTETWSQFMGQFTKALQPYAHYGRDLAQWQMSLVHVMTPVEPGQPIEAALAFRPGVCDEQLATRITLFHGLLFYVLGRIWIAAHPSDIEFATQIKDFGRALGQSAYLDGHQSDWGQQFWAMMWASDGQIVLE
ncbi:hypothetical protein [Caulobacter hibisci]|uniref:DUF2063 domain-containing protein n=1 Tax=Caulobacter hibisci TaxID=2035993 RepID=A0ABS0T872_9CAUL|nr:hypothetical protein [Caulobacter hibisci]MBI1687052.1 hypothetical protein [Caulobacter hibisci]